LAVEVLLDELDLGEAETIVLARQIHADWVLFVRSLPMYPEIWRPDSSGLFLTDLKGLYYMDIPDGEPVLVDQRQGEKSTYCGSLLALEYCAWLP
jgi:hypothetical protein